MAGLSKQRAAVVFCFLLSKHATDTVLKLERACRDDGMESTHTFEWLTLFEKGGMSIDANLVLGVYQLSKKNMTSWSWFERPLLGMNLAVAIFVFRVVTVKKEPQVETCRALKPYRKLIQIFIQESLLVMSHAAMVTTQKQKNSQDNGRRHLHSFQKYLVKSDQTTNDAGFTLVKQSIKLFICKYWEDSSAVLPRKDTICGRQETGASTTTIHLH